MLSKILKCHLPVDWWGTWELCCYDVTVQQSKASASVFNDKDSLLHDFLRHVINLSNTEDIEEIKQNLIR